MEAQLQICILNVMFSSRILQHIQELHPFITELNSHLFPHFVLLKKNNNIVIRMEDILMTLQKMKV